ncbi:hypothetical protein Taro_027482 [Colocasia esculenta]|uniref:C2H2-type domain-containing protein n=1 Tax=Colocasia esculenta TaxID=4460 RepID=A0A843VI82_COLES|nr:hypothetical protein [Colocasia esculenta]
MATRREPIQGRRQGESSGGPEEMIPEASCFMYGGGMEDMLSSSMSASEATHIVVPGAGDAHCSTLLSCLSVLRDKVQQVESIVGVVVSAGHAHQDSASMAVGGAGALIQEIIMTASSIMFALQQLALEVDMVSPDELASTSQQQQHDRRSWPSAGGTDDQAGHVDPEAAQGGCFGGQTVQQNNGYATHITAIHTGSQGKIEPLQQITAPRTPGACEIVELDAADLLAKYTHYCHVCGKGFKRDANLRMHMRAHGDEYKTSAALSNPAKGGGTGGGGEPAEYAAMAGPGSSPRKYSCPQEGCRWNRRHPRFQPLKSMVCVKNHYRRSHCPKMYVCNRCHRKQFSVLSDLRTHEKHCGDLRWRCSCGTTFSRKDKLMGHVALFAGHEPAPGCAASKQGVTAGARSLQAAMD